MTIEVADGTAVTVSTEVDVKLLKLGITPRLDGQDLEHARALSFRFDDWPPILLERSTSNVIDGVHRVLAARMLGRRRPLTLAEREAAAKRVLRMHADWSNRWVGERPASSDRCASTAQPDRRGAESTPRRQARRTGTVVVDVSRNGSRRTSATRGR